MFVCDSPFLYSKVQSNKTIRGFLISLLILGWVTSLFRQTPFKILDSVKEPPGIFSILTNRLISTLVSPNTVSLTILTAFQAISQISLSNLLPNLVPMLDLIIC
eukprot:NODE_58_length_28395_cov_1.465720.p31 type:complete len:104 gc:universal NODE_58_length_28395_cov_1.465720:26628-26317(-)